MFDKTCPYCGAKLSVYYNTGMLGCPECYNVFETEIDASLPEIQGGVRHVGKKPRYSLEDKELLNDYKKYLKEKEAALISGRFEDVKKISVFLSDIGDELKRRGITL